MGDVIRFDKNSHGAAGSRQIILNQSCLAQKFTIFDLDYLLEPVLPGFNAPKSKKYRIY